MSSVHICWVKDSWPPGICNSCALRSTVRSSLMCETAGTHWGMNLPNPLPKPSQDPEGTAAPASKHQEWVAVLSAQLTHAWFRSIKEISLRKHSQRDPGTLQDETWGHLLGKEAERLWIQLQRCWHQLWDMDKSLGLWVHFSCMKQDKNQSVYLPGLLGRWRRECVGMSGTEQTLEFQFPFWDKNPDTISLQKCTSFKSNLGAHCIF